MNINHYWQNNPRWKGTPLGEGKEGQTIGSHGCLLCCVASVYEYLTGDVMLPDKLNRELKKIFAFYGAYIDTHAVISLSRLLTGAEYTPCKTFEAPLEDIDKLLERNIPAIVWIDESSEAGVQDHWVVIAEKAGDDYLVMDPLQSDDKPRSLADLYPHAEPKVLILGILAYQSKLIPPIVTEGDYIDVVTNGLNLRSQPNLDNRYDVGDLPTGQQLKYAGETVEDGAITWAKAICYVALREGDREHARLVIGDNTTT